MVHSSIIYYSQDMEATNVPWTDEWIKMWCKYIHTLQNIGHKENEIFPFETTQMDSVGIMLREISHTDKDKYCMLSLICGIKKKKRMNKTNQKQSHRYKEQTSGYQ